MGGLPIENDLSSERVADEIARHEKDTLSPSKPRTHEKHINPIWSWSKVEKQKNQGSSYCGGWPTKRNSSASALSSSLKLHFLKKFIVIIFVYQGGGFLFFLFG